MNPSSHQQFFNTNATRCIPCRKILPQSFNGQFTDPLICGDCLFFASYGDVFNQKIVSETSLISYKNLVEYIKYNLHLCSINESFRKSMAASTEAIINNLIRDDTAILFLFSLNLDYSELQKFLQNFKIIIKPDCNEPLKFFMNLVAIVLDNWERFTFSMRRCLEAFNIDLQLSILYRASIEQSFLFSEDRSWDVERYINDIKKFQMNYASQSGINTYFRDEWSSYCKYIDSLTTEFKYLNCASPANKLQQKAAAKNKVDKASSKFAGLRGRPGTPKPSTKYLLYDSFSGFSTHKFVNNFIYSKILQIVDCIDAYDKRVLSTIVQKAIESPEDIRCPVLSHIQLYLESGRTEIDEMEWRITKAMFCPESADEYNAVFMSYKDAISLKLSILKGLVSRLTTMLRNAKKSDRLLGEERLRGTIREWIVQDSSSLKYITNIVNLHEIVRSNEYLKDLEGLACEKMEMINGRYLYSVMFLLKFVRLINKAEIYSKVFDSTRYTRNRDEKYVFRCISRYVYWYDYKFDLLNELFNRGILNEAVHRDITVFINQGEPVDIRELELIREEDGKNFHDPCHAENSAIEEAKDASDDDEDVKIIDDESEKTANQDAAYEGTPSTTAAPSTGSASSTATSNGVGMGYRIITTKQKKALSDRAKHGFSEYTATLGLRIIRAYENAEAENRKAAVYDEVRLYIDCFESCPEIAYQYWDYDMFPNTKISFFYLTHLYLCDLLKSDYGWFGGRESSLCPTHLLFRRLCANSVSITISAEVPWFVEVANKIIRHHMNKVMSGHFSEYGDAHSIMGVILLHFISDTKKTLVEIYTEYVFSAELYFRLLIFSYFKWICILCNRGIQARRSVEGNTIENACGAGVDEMEIGVFRAEDCSVSNKSGNANTAYGNPNNNNTNISYGNPSNNNANTAYKNTSNGYGMHHSHEVSNLRPTKPVFSNGKGASHMVFVNEADFKRYLEELVANFRREFVKNLRASRSIENVKRIFLIFVDRFARIKNLYKGFQAGNLDQKLEESITDILICGLEKSAAFREVHIRNIPKQHKVLEEMMLLLPIDDFTTNY